MPDIFLRAGAALPADVILRDPTVPDSGAGVALDGIIAAASALDGTLSLSKPLDGAIAGTGALTASLSLTKPLAGAIDAVSTQSAALSLSIPLSGVVAAASTLSGELTVAPLGVNLDGVISATSALTATSTLTVIPSAAAISTGGARRRPIRWETRPFIAPRQRIGGRGESGQPLQFSEGAGRVRIVRRGVGDSAQRRQQSAGMARLDFEAITERELLELILLEAA